MAVKRRRNNIDSYWSVSINLSYITILLLLQLYWQVTLLLFLPQYWPNSTMQSEIYTIAANTLWSLSFTSSITHTDILVKHDTIPAEEYWCSTTYICLIRNLPGNLLPDHKSLSCTSILKPLRHI